MLLFASLLVALQSPSYAVIRDPFGVPTVTGKTEIAAFEGAGYATAQDRLWQMERGRRLAEGRLAESFGSRFLPSDRDVARLGYTSSEIDQQVEQLPARVRAAMIAYAKGVNAWITEAKATGHLPAGYAENDLTPAPWTVQDSAAIAIHLFQQFGRGGAGELRNLALLKYLQTRSNLKGKTLDVIDDLAWLQDPAATPTLSPADSLGAHHPSFPNPTRAQTESQIASLPPISILELLPGIQISMNEVSHRVAERIGAPFHTGSYAMIVAPKRSQTGHPLLLSGPQMGFTNPSIVHEVNLIAPGFRVAGIDVPGVPGVIVGRTNHFSWALTSGVADVEDVFAFPLSAAGTYRLKGHDQPLETVKFRLSCKGGTATEVDQMRTEWGPVVVQTKSCAFALRSAFRGRELSSLAVLFNCYGARSAAQVDQAVQAAPMSFNFFYAFPTGTIGYRYCGRVPIRNPRLDPRIPAIANAENDWRGFIPPSQMPHVVNPASGLLVNWNNKPAAWWPNGDTPVWGAIFHNTTILDQLGTRKLTAKILRITVAEIAKTDANWKLFNPWFEAASGISSFDGRLIDRSQVAGQWVSFFLELRSELFLKTTGSFLSDATFQLVLQPSVMLKALQGRTHFDYLAGRTPAAVCAAAWQRAKGAPPYRAGGIKIPSGDPILYSNRGTFIQLVEYLAHGARAETILPPGEAEAGAHLEDQVDLARGFGFKPSWMP